MNTNHKREKTASSHLKRLLNYQSIVRQVPFFLFLAALAVVYIYIGHLSEKTMRNIVRSTSELKDLRNEFKSVKGEALLSSRQSEIKGAAHAIGLVELTEEPGILVDSIKSSKQQ